MNKALREKFGQDLFDVHKKLAARIAAILKRGKIRSDDEYVRMSEWMDYLDCDDLDDLEEIGRIEKLMCEYEDRAAKKLAKKRAHNNK